MMASTGQRIKSLRLAKNMTLEELGQKIGVTKATINKYENGLVVNLKRKVIADLAEALETSPAYLMGWEDDLDAVKNLEALPEMKTVPVIGRIACGEPLLACENLEGEAEVAKNVFADFALRCAWDSVINARIFDGDLVFIRRQDDVDNGTIAAVIIGDEATLKRVYKYPNRVELRPENPTYPVLNYEGERLNDIRIIGKAVAFTSTHII